MCTKSYPFARHPLNRRLLMVVFVCIVFSVRGFASGIEKFLIGFNQTPVEEVFERTQKLFKVQFTYEASMIKGVPKINLPAKERSLDELLSNLSAITELRFLQVGNLVGVQRASSNVNTSSIVFSQLADIKIEGVVTDNNNQPITGATITIKGSTKSTFSDDNGHFMLTVPEGSTLVVTSVGFQTREIKAVANAPMKITLVQSEASMEEVVVTALGIKKEKRKISYSTQEVKGKDIEKAREPNVIGNLTGKVAGLSVRTKTTLYENPEVRLRGGPTMVVIDGVPTTTDFWNISSDDVESINVLKGTAATALYGSLGINGAIMITTKKGKAGANGIEVSFNSTNQFQAGFLRIPETQTEYGMGWNGQYAFKDGRGNGLYDDYGYVYGPKLNQKDPSTQSGYVEIPQYNSPIDPQTGERVPLPWVTRSSSNVKKFLQNEFFTTNNISIAGKTDKSDYRISLSHMYQQGQIPNTHLNSTTLSLAGSLQISKRMRGEATLSYNRQYTPNYPVTGYGPDNFFYNIILWMGPEVDVNDMRKYWVPGREGVEQLTYNYTWYNNPWFLAYEHLRGYWRDAVVAQANLTYDFTPDLSFLIRSGASINSTTADLKTPYSFINYSDQKAPFGNYSITESGSLLVVSDALLTYKKKFLKDFTANISAGASNRIEQSRNLNSKTVDLSIPGVYNLSNSRNPVQSINKLTEKQVNSAYGYSEISYKDAVYLNLTGRNDWTSALQKPFNSYFYPSASVGVIPSELIKLPSAVSFFKVRASWANIASDVPAYYTLTTYTPGVRWNGEPSLNLPGTLIAPDLKPRRTVSQEYGTELRFFSNRLGIDFTYYNYTDKDSVVDVPISSASGYNSRRLNGDINTRKGVEVILTGTPVRNANFRWDVIVNYSKHRTYIKEYYGGDTIRNGIKVGSRADVMRGYIWDRSPNGEIVYFNGLPQYVNQVVNLGFSEPDWEFGFANNLVYKNFNLRFSFDGRIGGKMVNGIEAKLYEGGMHKSTVNSYRDDAYAGVNSYVGKGVVATSGAVERDAFGNVISDTRKFETNTEKANYIDWIFASYTNGIDEAVLYKRTFVKLREIVLTYSFTPKLLQRTPFKSANVSLVGRNLALWTNVPFMDPDGYASYDLAEPSYRNIGFNINLKF